MHEGRVTNTRDAVGDGEGSKTNTAIESITLNARNAVGDVNARKCGAIIKGIFPDAFNPNRDAD